MRKRGSLPYASTSARRLRVYSVRSGMSAPLSGPNRPKTTELWSRNEPGWSYMTSPSSTDIAAISINMCASNRF